MVAPLIIITGLAWGVLALAVGQVAAERDISRAGGILLALLIGPLALAVVLLMPSRRWD